MGVVSETACGNVMPPLGLWQPFPPYYRLIAWPAFGLAWVRSFIGWPYVLQR